MASCYHGEIFILGIVAALFIFAILTLFEDALKEWFEKVRKKLVV